MAASDTAGAIAFDHTAIAVPDNGPAREFVLDLLGGTVRWNGWTDGDPPSFQGVQIDLEDTMLELIAPAGPASFVTPFLAKRGRGLHHITWKPDDLDALVAELEERGVPLTGVERRSGRVVNAFVRPSSSFGVLTQFRPSFEWNADAKIDHPARRNLPPPRTSRGRIRSTAVAVSDGPPAVGFFQSLLGGQSGPIRREADAFVQSLDAAGTRLDFYWPAEEGRYERFVAERGPGIHHIAFELSLMDEAVSAARSLGLRFQAIDGVDPADEVFVDSDNPTGALLRFVRRR